MYRIRRSSGPEGNQALRVERTAIRIWELLELMGELSLEEIQEKVNVKPQDPIFNAAILWLLRHEFAKERFTPAGPRMKSH